MTWLVAVLLISVAGCVYVPTPEHRTVSERGRLTTETLDQLEPGQSSRADVILLLGEPSRREKADQYIYYSWAVIQGYLIIPYAATLDVPNVYVLALKFNDDANLSRYKTFESGLFDDLDEAIEKWKTEG